MWYFTWMLGVAFASAFGPAAPGQRSPLDVVVSKLVPAELVNRVEGDDVLAAPHRRRKLVGERPRDMFGLLKRRRDV